VRRIRDEVHRFGINFHRDKRSSATFANSLEEIKGIGQSTANQLLKTFRSVKNIREQTLDELARVIGPSKARIVKTWFEEEGNG
jgi:excinuclease ABC subunit C